MNQPGPSASSLDIASVMHGLVDALQGFGVLDLSGSGAAAPCGLADDALLDATVQVEALGRIVDGLRVRMAGEVAARSAAELGEEGLSRSHNFRSPVAFLGSVLGASDATLRERLRLADCTHESVSLAGLPNPSRFPRVAEALSRGELGVDAAVAITRRLTDVASRIGFTEELSEAEGDLVAHAQQAIGGFGYSAREVAQLAERYAAHLDSDGAEPRERDLHEARFFTMRQCPSGATRLSGLLPPSMAGTLLAAMEPLLSPRTVAFPTDPDDSAEAPPSNVIMAAAGMGLAPTEPATSGIDPAPSGIDLAIAIANAVTVTFATEPATPAPDLAISLADPATSSTSNPDPATSTSSGNPRDVTTESNLTADARVSADFAAIPETDEVTRDTRTAGQKRADALVQLLTLATSHPGMPRLNGAAPTVNLHATLDDVVAGRGVGWIDGLDTPVPYTTVEQLLCHSDVITTLFGQHGQVLQHGKTRRLFTAAQNRALAARDGGCVWPGCDAPPAWCESHHVDGWLSADHPGGVTDIDNGALLCHFHHTRVHSAKWKLAMVNGTPHLIPPEWLDWSRTPRPCQQNRARQRPSAHPPGGRTQIHHADRVRSSARRPSRPDLESG